MHGHGADTGKEFSVLLEVRHVTDREDLWKTGERAVVFDEDAALAVERNALGSETCPEVVRANTGAPDDGGREQVIELFPASESGQLVVRDDFEVGAVGPDVHDARIRADLDPELAELVDGAARQIFGEARQEARSSFDQDDARGSRVDRAEILAQDEARELGDRSGELHARRPAADDHEGQQLATLALVVGALGTLEGDEHPASNFDRVFDALQARRKALPIVVTEVRGLRANREHEPVVREDAAAPGIDGLALQVDVANFAQHHANVVLLGEDRANRGGDLRGR
ncbi:hypothetical protein AKJ09_11313 [Labilithrix luteola]|uniref:Uncharacterized protein n=1 Tax=Labilithrix luteola TaxID=1391654 RepID=A0A0K1QGT8_9BACT|nr:hypothetical protein AKJ09_11313 [Labilithrix luteola]